MKNSIMLSLIALVVVFSNWIAYGQIERSRGSMRKFTGK